MKSLAPCCLLSVALLSSWSHAAAPDPALVGCWRAAKIVQYGQDDSKTEDASGRCTLQFKEEEMVSSCATANGTVTSTYRYRIPRPNVYSATMASSTFSTNLVGSTREYEYHVEGDRLTTATTLHTTMAAGPPVTLRVETDAARTPCP